MSIAQFVSGIILLTSSSAFCGHEVIGPKQEVNSSLRIDIAGSESQSKSIRLLDPRASEDLVTGKIENSKIVEVLNALSRGESVQVSDGEASVSVYSSDVFNDGKSLEGFLENGQSYRIDAK